LHMFKFFYPSSHWLTVTMYRFIECMPRERRQHHAAHAYQSLAKLKRSQPRKGVGFLNAFKGLALLLLTRHDHPAFGWQAAGRFLRSSQVHSDPVAWILHHGHECRPRSALFQVPARSRFVNNVKSLRALMTALDDEDTKRNSTSLYLSWLEDSQQEHMERPTRRDAAVDQLIKDHWRASDGVIDDEEEEIMVDMHELPPDSRRPFVGDRPSAYGEVALGVGGVRTLLRAMGLWDVVTPEPSAVFVDLGSGAGRLVAQAWLDLPNVVAQAIGVELAPSRHKAAVRAWKSVCAADDDQGLLLRKGDGPEYRLGSMFETDLSLATHIYVASLCFSEELQDQLWAHLTKPDTAPRLQVVASLSKFRGPSAEAAHSKTVNVKMTWNHGNSGTPVQVYRLRDAIV